ncbi:VacJ family lipoprotein [Magnetospira sp. QH-2]|uniref:MlaA family lipoprotein n=1 Tax=Magnetospira sp. (strain QH-2) TaxID=1288970 RepID=UPI0005F9F71E|nr:VacJ family lipoprotein [Magnetospira sp. QH-2]
MRPILTRLSALAVTGLLVAGCATPPPADDPEAVADFRAVNDPIEPTNRMIHGFNSGFDTLLYKPATTLYKGLTPPPLQEGVHNMLSNVHAPVTMVNEMLQGEFERAWETFLRFLINSTIGIGGLRDQATEWGYAPHSEDFGQTLAVWGLDEGPYLVLPILGPSNPRDAVGMAVDFFLDPFNYAVTEAGHSKAIWARNGMRAIDYRARNFDVLEELERSSLDYYATLRSLYRQRRDDEIRNGATHRGSGPATSTLEGPGPLTLEDEISQTQQ